MGRTIYCLMKYLITERQYHILKEEEEKVIHFPSIDYFGGWYEMQSYLDKKGNPLYSIDGNLKLIKTPIESLGNLTSVGGYLDLESTSIKSLGNLTSVGGYLNLESTSIKSLGNLTSVGGYLDLEGTSIESLGNLTSVGGYLYLEGTSIESFGNLTSVGGDLFLKDILAFKKYSIKEIEKMVNVKGKIYI